jgi:hypothetical protein
MPDEAQLRLLAFTLAVEPGIGIGLILAPKQERQRIAAYIPRWGIQLAAHLSESTAWAIYRDRLKRFGTLIGDREPIVLHKEIPGMGRAKRYIITIADDDRRPLAGC